MANKRFVQVKGKTGIWRIYRGWRRRFASWGAYLAAGRPKYDFIDEKALLAIREGRPLRIADAEQ